MESKVFSEEFQVRDYEVDMFGIVNNAVYQNYFEHTRHQFLNHIGFELLALLRSGQSAVVSNINIKFIRPLQSRNRFISTIKIKEKRNVRRIFIQELFFKDSGKAVAYAEVTCVFLNNENNPVIPSKEFLDGIAPYVLKQP